MPVETNQSNKNLIPRSFLQSGQDLKITDKISFKHPTVQEVMDIDKEHLGLYSEDLYYSMVNVFLTDPYTYMVFLDDKGIDYETVTSFEVFCMLYDEYNKKFINFYSSIGTDFTEEQIREIFKNNIYFKAFNFFFGIEKFFVAHDEEGNKVLGYNENDFLMDSESFDFVCEFVRKMNGIPDIKKINPEDEWAKQILIEDEREKIKKKSKKKNSDSDEKSDRLGNLLSSVTWCCNGGITPFNRNQLHMYDLIDGIHKTDKLLNYKNTMVGLYSGCIEKKKINFNEIHWSSD